MPKGRNNIYTSSIEPFVAEFYANFGREPELGEVLKAFPQFSNHRQTISKAIKTIMGRLPQNVQEAGMRVVAESKPAGDAIAFVTAQLEGRRKNEVLPEFAPSSGGRAARLENAYKLLDAVIQRSGNVVDVMAVDKLTRLIEELEATSRKEAEDKKLSKGEDNPTWSAMLNDFQVRKIQGSVDKRPKFQVSDGVSDCE